MASGASWIPFFLMTGGWGQVIAVVLGSVSVLILVLIFPLKVA